MLIPVSLNINESEVIGLSNASLTPIRTTKPLKLSFAQRLGKNFLRHYELYLFALPPVLYFIIFHYFPMYGVQIAFKDFQSGLGIWGSPWVGLKHFKRFFNSYQFQNLIKNTLSLSIYSLIAGFPAPILLALMLNDVSNERFKKLVQTATYAPHFISVVTVAGMILIFLSLRTGIIPNIIRFLGGEPRIYMADPKLFKHIYVLSGLWQGTGFGAIIYFAALSGIDKNLYEAALIDGATKLKRIIHIDLPSIVPTIIIMLILSCGGLLSVGFEKVLLLQNNLNVSSSEVIATYVYKQGLTRGQFSYTTAIGLFNSIVSFILLTSVNFIAKHLGETSLW